ncbi:MAG: patatin-like phospholipase family protein [Pseudomonadota bacterium]
MAKNQNVKKINLALQGGGAHGAYTWGVLDRILEEERLEIEGISGTSAGAMNAAILVDGYIKNGRNGAKEALETFWHTISEMGEASPIQHAPFQKFIKMWNMDWSPTFLFYDIITRLFSPYQTNPFNINPLQEIIAKTIDFENLRKSDSIKLFVAATSVTTGQPKIFGTKEMTPDAVMASACLPFLFQSVEINNDYYWDGGYMGNPSIWPLTYNCVSKDILIVEINPIVRKEKPTEAKDIINRLNEISFNSSLIAEMRAINFVNKLIDDNHLQNNKEYKKLNIHLISSPEEMLKMNASSKMNASWDFFCHLHTLGRNAADKWIKENFDKIGVDSSINIEEVFLALVKQPKL